MVRSMTAFARQTMESDLGALTLELKSVNHRFSEVSLRLPEELRAVESKIRDRMGQVVSRGKIDANFRYQPPIVAAGFDIDRNLLATLAATSKDVETHLPGVAPIRMIDVLKWPGVLKFPEIDAEQLSNMAMALLDKALTELMETREREGEKLKQLLLERCAAMSTEVAKVQQRIPAAIEAMRQRLKEKLAEWKAELDEIRLEQEVVFLCNKSDVAEEMDRLQAHIEEVKRVLSEKKPMGRRLDFLMQELNREANTLGSKSPDTEMTRASVELKVLIEQMREQVQNIE
ncbi:MAG: YicC family protein [Gammaproteobacteria bacterium]|nr:YicC family protein [Gammaproteobacteria bacterium]